MLELVPNDNNLEPSISELDHKAEIGPSITRLIEDPRNMSSKKIKAVFESSDLVKEIGLYLSIPDLSNLYCISRFFRGSFTSKEFKEAYDILMVLDEYSIKKTRMIRISMVLVAVSVPLIIFLGSLMFQDIAHIRNGCYSYTESYFNSQNETCNDTFDNINSCTKIFGEPAIDWNTSLSESFISYCIDICNDLHAKTTRKSFLPLPIVFAIGCLSWGCLTLRTWAESFRDLCRSANDVTVGKLPVELRRDLDDFINRIASHLAGQYQDSTSIWELKTLLYQQLSMSLDPIENINEQELKVEEPVNRTLSRSGLFSRRGDYQELPDSTEGLRLPTKCGIM